MQKKFLKTQQQDILEKQKDHPSVEAASAVVAKTVSTSPRQTDPIRVQKTFGWCLTAQVYIVVINKISQAKQRHLVRKQILDSLQPPKYVMSNLEMVYFLSGRLVR